MTSVIDLIENNKHWAEGKTQIDPDFFARLVRQQSPAYLWIGCSDSRVPANEIVGLDPGELFVHRNVANLAPPQDANYLSVLQYAVQVLQVKHILVVGHYGCGGVIASTEHTHHGLIDHWLTPIRLLSVENREELEKLPEGKPRYDRLCELNVIRQVRNVASNPFVLEAWEQGRDLTVHGWCYSIENGLVRDLDVSITNRTDAQAMFERP
jgi:carbonic anhydrase